MRTGLSLVLIVLFLMLFFALMCELAYRLVQVSRRIDIVDTISSTRRVVPKKSLQNMIIGPGEILKGAENDTRTVDNRGIRLLIFKFMTFG